MNVTRIRLNRAGAFLAFLALSSSHAFANGAGPANGVISPPVFPAENVAPALVVQDADVMDVMMTLLQRYHIPIRTMSDDIEGIVSGSLGDVSVPVILNRLGALHGFYWYYDGSYVEVGPADEVAGEAIKIAPAKTESFYTDLAGMGMEFSQFPVSVNADTGVVFVRGPDSFRSIIRELAHQYQANPSSPEKAPEDVDVVAAMTPKTPIVVRVIYGRDPATSGVPIVQSHSFPPPSTLLAGQGGE